ncbi:disease resistance protein RGA2-like [Citrus clementina]|uniref:disease resistance protein RGA2-like n=1 Tax=Citrus clementina TaxID=85681 RepID=UPI000CECFF88|nr:disease resistance protein RGA2-like [Citrus x clementina]
MALAIVCALLDQLNSIAQEKWRLLTGVEQEVGKLTTNLQAIQAVLEDAEQRQMKQDRAVTLWLDQLRDASYDMEDVLDKWITETRKSQLDEGGDDEDDDNDNAFVTLLTKVCSFFPAASNCFGCFKQLSLRHHITVKIREISKRLDDIARQKDSFKFVENVSNNVKKPERVRTTSLIDKGEVFGRVDEKNELLSKLLCDSSEQHPHIISLVGFGGIGKTTLAQLAYNDDEVKINFEKVIWACVSDTFEEIRVAKAIIEGLGESKKASGLSEFQSLMSHIHRSIGGKKFFLVLDDVWDGDSNKWDPFFFCLKNGLHGSKILVTTRNESIARMMGTTESDTISIEQLAEEECWLFSKQLAFFGRCFEDCERLEPIGRKIARKCKGLPLAAKVIGNLLRSKITVKEWQRMLDSEMWKLEEIGQGLLAPLLLSYNDLPSNSMVKRCFSYCVVFPNDYSMNKEELISLWMAQGYFNAEEDEEMEMIGEEYFNILAARSFFQEFKKDYFNDRIREIPENVGKLIHLKYLNLNGLCIKRLPETLCELYNLQKLDIRWCRNLRELPAGIGKLMNMRSLLNYDTRSLKYMPIGISRLTSLRTLEKFVVGGGVDGGSTCRLESLKNLQLLRECRVEGLSNVSHVDEAERLQLYNKKNLLRLNLKFGIAVDGEGEEGRRKNEKDKQLLEALQPPLNVEELRILSYGGNMFPKWLTLLTNRRELRIDFCENLQELPILEDCRTTDIPHLSFLIIQNCPKLKVLPDYLLRTTTLQKLTIWRCPLLENRYREGKGVDWHKISHIPHIKLSLWMP